MAFLKTTVKTFTYKFYLPGEIPQSMFIFMFLAPTSLKTCSGLHIHCQKAVLIHIFILAMDQIHRNLSPVSKVLNSLELYSLFQLNALVSWPAALIWFTLTALMADQHS